MFTSLVDLHCPVEFLNEKFAKRIFKGSDCNKLADHEQDGADGLGKDLPEKPNDLKISLTHQDNPV